MEFASIEAVSVLPTNSRGNYDELAFAIIGTDGTGNAIHVTGVGDEELTKRLIPAVRRIVANKLDKRLIVGVAKNDDGTDKEGVAFCLGGNIAHDSGKGRPKGSVNKKLAVK
jgi:hypothetical protein